MHVGNFMKKFVVLSGSAVVLSGLFLSPTFAADDPVLQVLKQIEQDAREILLRVNDLPVYIGKMMELAFNLQKNDDSASTASLQGNFATTGNMIVQDTNLQVSAIPSFNKDLLGDANAQNMPWANDVLYGTMLGQPMFNPDPRNEVGKPPTANPPYNYIKNIAGINLPHTLPKPNWQGTDENKARYIAYYNTVMGVESFNGYVLSNQLADLQNGNALTTAQMNLVTKASSSDWLAEVSSEEIGKVLRQLLIFESQNYVLTTQLLQTQKQLLAAQAMNNALTIAANQTNEGINLQRAQGAKISA